VSALRPNSCYACPSMLSTSRERHLGADAHATSSLPYWAECQYMQSQILSKVYELFLFSRAMPPPSVPFTRCHQNQKPRTASSARPLSFGSSDWRIGARSGDNEAGVSLMQPFGRGTVMDPESLRAMRWAGVVGHYQPATDSDRQAPDGLGKSSGPYLQRWGGN